MTKTKEFEEVFGRLRELGIKTQQNLAEVLKITQSAVSDAKKRGSFPKNWASIISKTYNCSLDWLLTGQKPISEQNQESPRQQQAKNKKGLNSAENADFEVKAIKTTQTGNLGEENDEMYRLKFEEAQEKIIRLLEENAELKRLLISRSDEKKAGKIRKTR